MKLQPKLAFLSSDKLTFATGFGGWDILLLLQKYT